MNIHKANNNHFSVLSNKKAAIFHYCYNFFINSLFIKKYSSGPSASPYQASSFIICAASSQLHVSINSTNPLYSSFIITLPRKAVYILKDNFFTLLNSL